jgi:hypothetical protein
VLRSAVETDVQVPTKHKSHFGFRWRCVSLLRVPELLVGFSIYHHHHYYYYYYYYYY